MKFAQKPPLVASGAAAEHPCDAANTKSQRIPVRPILVMPPNSTTRIASGSQLTPCERSGLETCGFPMSSAISMAWSSSRAASPQLSWEMHNSPM